METVTVLKDLGFSFWQLVVIFVVLLFRLEIRQILERIKNIKSLKILGNEFILNEADIELVKDIRKIENEATKQGSTAQEIGEELSSVLRRRCLGALLNIRSINTLPWSELKNLLSNQFTIVTDIRLEDYKEIEPNLRLLSAAGMFEFSTLPKGGSSRAQKLSLHNIHPLLREFIHQAERF